MTYAQKLLYRRSGLHTAKFAHISATLGSTTVPYKTSNILLPTRVYARLHHPIDIRLCVRMQTSVFPKDGRVTFRACSRLSIFFSTRQVSSSSCYLCSPPVRQYSFALPSLLRDCPMLCSRLNSIELRHCTTQRTWSYKIHLRHLLPKSLSFS